MSDDGTNIKKHWKSIYQPSYFKICCFLFFVVVVVFLFVFFFVAYLFCVIRMKNKLIFILQSSKLSIIKFDFILCQC